MQGADPWGHSASLSPKEEQGAKLTWGERQTQGEGAWQSWENSLESHLHELPPWGSSPGAGWHVLSLLRAVASHMPRQWPEGSQETPVPRQPGVQGFLSHEGPGIRNAGLVLFLHLFYAMSIFKPTVLLNSQRQRQD